MQLAPLQHGRIAPNNHANFIADSAGRTPRRRTPNARYADGADGRGAFMCCSHNRPLITCLHNQTIVRSSLCHTIVHSSLAHTIAHSSLS